MVVCWRTFDQGAGHVWDTLSNDADDPRVRDHAARDRDRGADQHRLRDHRRARDRPPRLPAQGAPERVHRPAARTLAGRRRPLALPALRARRLVRRLVPAHGDRHPLRAAVDGAGDDLRLAPVRGPRGRSRRCARSATSRSRPPGRSARRSGRRSGGSRCRRSAGR